MPPIRTAGVRGSGSCRTLDSKIELPSDLPERRSGPEPLGRGRRELTPPLFSFVSSSRTGRQMLMMLFPATQPGATEERGVRVPAAAGRKARYDQSLDGRKSRGGLQTVR